MSAHSWAVIVSGSDPSVLRDTIERVVRCVDEDRVVVVAADSREEMACEVLAGRGGVYLALEPCDRGPGMSALFGLAFALEADPDAIVCLAAPDGAIRVVGGRRRELTPDHAEVALGCVMWEILEQHLP